MQAQERVEAKQAGASEQDHRDGVLVPFLFGFGVDPGELAERPFDRTEERLEEGFAILEDVGHEGPDRVGRGHDQREGQDNLEKAGQHYTY